MRRGSVVGVIIAAAIAVAAMAIAVVALWGPGGTPTGTATPDEVTPTDFCYVESEIYYGVETIELADAILAKDGVDPDVSAYAQTLRDDTSGDVEELRAWYREWIGARPLEPATEGPCAGHADHAQMPGMPSFAERTALTDADGAEAQQIFLELMTTQTEGRIAVAEEFLRSDPHPRVVARAEQTVAQGDEQLALLADLAAG